MSTVVARVTISGVSPPPATAAGTSPRRSGGGRRDTGRVMSSRVTSTRFVGRATELAELRAGLAEATGGRPGLAFLAGESGVGKTRLLTELEHAARADGVKVIGGDCVELGEGELPYAPIVGPLRPRAPARDPALPRPSLAAPAPLPQVLPRLRPGRRPP